MYIVGLGIAKEFVNHCIGLAKRFIAFWPKNGHRCRLSNQNLNAVECIVGVETDPAEATRRLQMTLDELNEKLDRLCGSVDLLFSNYESRHRSFTIRNNDVLRIYRRGHEENLS